MTPGPSRRRARIAAAAVAVGAVVLGTPSAALAEGEPEVAFRIDVSTIDAGDAGRVCVDVRESTHLGERTEATVCSDDTSAPLVVPAAGLPTTRYDGSRPTFVVQVRPQQRYAPTWFGSSVATGVSAATALTADGQTLGVTLPVAGVLTGKLVNRDGDPVENVTPLAFDAAGDLVSDAEVAADGTWTMRVFPTRIALGYRDDEDAITERAVTAVAGRTVDVGEYRFDRFGNAPRPVTVQGQVRDRSTGKPVAGVCVYNRSLPLHGLEEQLGNWDAASGCPYFAPVTRTDAKGRFKAVIGAASWNYMQGEALSYLSFIDPSGSHTRTYTWYGMGTAAGAEITYDVAMEPAYAFKGRVVDTSGAPVAGVCPLPVDLQELVVQLRRCSDAAGWYAAGELPSELAGKRISVPLSPRPNGPVVGFSTVYAPGVPTTKGAASVALKLGRTPTAPLTTLRGTTLRGRVTDAQGRPVSGVTVTLSTERAGGGPSYPLLLTDENGQYGFYDVRVPGPVFLRFDDPQGRFLPQWSGPSSTEAGAQPVPLTAGGTTVRDVTLTRTATLFAYAKVAGVPATATAADVTLYAPTGAEVRRTALDVARLREGEAAGVTFRDLVPGTVTVRVGIYDRATRTTRSFWYTVAGSAGHARLVLGDGESKNVMVEGTW
ncbi:MAG: carboxypeptidase-like regulatory domain-containing protein [Kineosporiaceae bacterium]